MKRPREDRIRSAHGLWLCVSGFAFLRQQTCTSGRRPKAAPEAKVKKAGKRSEHVGSLRKGYSTLLAERPRNGKREIIEGVTPATPPRAWT
jgi:hypothetical protein